MKKEKMNVIYCPFDTHEKELTCKYYQPSLKDEPVLGCFCAFMLNDWCCCVDRIHDYDLSNEKNNQLS